MSEYLYSAYRYFSASKVYEEAKDQAIHNAVLVITALAAYNLRHPEQSLHIRLFCVKYLLTESPQTHRFWLLVF